MFLNWTGVTSVDFVVFETFAESPGHMLRIDNVVIPEVSTYATIVGAVSFLGVLAVRFRRKARQTNQGDQIGDC